MNLSTAMVSFSTGQATTPPFRGRHRPGSRSKHASRMPGSLRAAAILGLLSIALAANPGRAADLTTATVTPSVTILPLGATIPLTATGHFTDGSNRRLSHATIASGGNHTCALAANGEVRCWGRGASGQLGNGSSTDSSVPVTVAGISEAVALAAGGDASCALLGDASVRCWGANGAGQLGNGSTAPTAIPVTVPGLTATALSSGFAHTCAVLATREVACWGANDSGQLGNGTTTSSTVRVDVVGL